MIFKCPECENSALDATYTGVIQTVPIIQFDSADPEEDWDDAFECYDACEITINCRSCGYELPVSTIQDLAEYLEHPEKFEVGTNHHEAPWGKDRYGIPYTEEDARSAYDDERLHAMREGED